MGTPSVVFLVNHSSAGGAQELWVNLAEGFAARGYDVRLMALYPHRKDVRATPPHLPWNYVVAKRPRYTGFRVLTDLVRAFRRNPPDIVFTAMPAANVLVPLAARLAGVRTKVVLSHHSPVQTHNPLLNFADSWTGSLSNVATIISVSDAVGASLAGKPRRYRDKRLTVRNALPPRIEEFLAGIAPAGAGRRRQGRNIVATGRLAAQKNYATLLRATALMPGVHVSIIGTGPDEGLLKDLARDLGIADRVSFLGHRPREETLTLLSAGDVFVQPSLFEGHSLALIEAAKLKLPLVVSNVPTQIEGITGADGRRCGIAVDPADPAALAREVLRLLDEPDHYAHWVEQSNYLGTGLTYDSMIGAYERLAEAAARP